MGSLSRPLAVAAVLAFLRAAASAAAGEQGAIVLLGDRSYPPLSYLEDGEPRGMDVDIASALASAMGRPVRIELLDWGEAQQRVLRGDADGLLSMSISDERRDIYEFTDATARHDFTLFVRRGEVTVSSESIPPGVRVGVTRGGFPRVVLQRRGTPDLVLINDYPDGFRRLHDGTIDALAGDSWVGAYIVQRDRLQDITVAGEPFAAALAGIAVRKGNGALLDQLNHAIQARRADGTIDSIQKRWKPQDVLFLSRQRVRDLVARVGGGVLVLALVALLLWVWTLKRQVRARRAVEAALRENDQSLRVALAGANMGTWRWSAATNTTRRDAKLNEMAGLPAIDSEHPFDELFERIHPEDREATRQAFERTVRDREPYDTEYRVVVPGGTSRWLRALGRPISSASGELSYVTGAVVDITDRKQAEEARERQEQQARHSERLQSIGRLAGGVAHDFNNLLTVINGYADILQTQLPEGGSLGAHAREIRTAGERAAELTRQLLTFSRKQVTAPQDVHLNLLVQEAAAMIARLVTERIEVTTVLAATPDRVLANPGELHQVLMNLAANARDAMPEGGFLRIETGNVDVPGPGAAGPPGPAAGSYVLLTVADSGSGMSAEEINHLFEPFFTTKGVGQGTGLGLATVHGIVEGGGGFITVDSAIGKGSLFRIHLPCNQRAAGETRPQANDPVLTGRETVLVVEDQEAVRRLAVHCLLGSGYQVLEAALARDALERLEQYPTHIDLLLTDVVMPGMSGIELAARARTLRPGTQILYMSGYNEELGPSNGSIPVDTGCLRKPFGPAELLAAVRRALDATQTSKATTTPSSPS